VGNLLGMKIIIGTVPHKNQRYETCGDWYTETDGAIHIKVSDMGNDDYEFLVALHELCEYWLCNKRGIPEEKITAFDVQFERDRDKGLHGEDEEPGDDPNAPYRREHFFATNIERMMAHELGVDWAEYNRTIMSL